MLGTEITLLESLRERARQDLGIDITFEVLNFLDAQRKAAMQPQSFDVYDQCFHNLDIVWFWQAIQPIDTQRIVRWDDVSALAREGRMYPSAAVGRGDAPVKRLYVQPGHLLGPKLSRYISMLPTVYNLDSFVYRRQMFTQRPVADASWAWLFDEESKGHLAMVDEPAIGVFDAALAMEAAGQIEFADLGNMTIDEIDRLMNLLEVRKRAGFFSGFWTTAAQSAQFMASGRSSIQSIWSPGIAALRASGTDIVEAVPAEGYRAWHGGMCLARHLTGRTLDVAYEYLNWWLTGWPGALMSRQGYYVSVPQTARGMLSAEEWDYWYGGQPARCDLPGTDGRTVVRAGDVRAGGGFQQRAGRIAVWNTTMDEHNYLVRRWDQFVS